MGELNGHAGQKHEGEHDDRPYPQQRDWKNRDKLKPRLHPTVRGRDL
jgi:hypothetical protein